MQNRTKNRLLITPKIITIGPRFAHKLRVSGWLFDWSLTSGTTVIALTDETNKIHGLLSFHNSVGYTNMDLIESAPYNRGGNRLYYGVGKALFALVARISINSGNDGFVLLTPKTKLRKYYANTMGTKEIGDGNQFLDPDAAHELVNLYTIRETKNG